MSTQKRRKTQLNDRRFECAHVIVLHEFFNDNDDALEYASQKEDHPLQSRWRPYRILYLKIWALSPWNFNDSFTLQNFTDDKNCHSNDPPISTVTQEELIFDKMELQSSKWWRWNYPHRRRTDLFQNLDLTPESSISKVIRKFTTRKMISWKCTSRGVVNLVINYES